MQKAYIYSILVIFVLLLTGSVSGADYSPVISGNLEIGDKFYTDSGIGEEEVIDEYHYRDYWLKYKQKINTSEYYYLKFKYYKKEYRKKTSYDNITLDFQGNYTFFLQDNLRNKLKLMLRDKDYYFNPGKSYQAVRLKYEINYDYNADHDYTFYLQRQWNNYMLKDINDNTSDRLSLTWEYEVSDKLELETEYQLERQQYRSVSDRSNKQGKSISFGFKCEI